MSNEAADNPQGPATQQSDPRDAEIAKLRQDNLAARQYVNSRDAELKALREQVGQRRPQQPTYQPAYEEPEEPIYDGGGRFDSEQRKQREMQRDYELAETRFLVKNPEAAKKWARVDEVVQKMKLDPFTASQYVSRDEHGDINWNKMFNDIYKDIELAELRAARTTPAPPQAAASLPPGAHTISGGVDNTALEGFDPNTASVDELREMLVRLGQLPPKK